MDQFVFSIFVVILVYYTITVTIYYAISQENDTSVLILFYAIMFIIKETLIVNLINTAQTDVIFNFLWILIINHNTLLQSLSHLT